LSTEIADVFKLVKCLKLFVFFYLLDFGSIKYKEMFLDGKHVLLNPYLFVCLKFL